MANVNAPKIYEKYARTLLFAFWTLHLVLSARDFFPSLQDFCIGCLPGAQTAIQSSTGMSWSQLALTNPKLAGFLTSVLVDDGISGVGLAVFGMIVSLTSFRRGEKWAWYVSWSMPIGILAAQLNVYLLTMSVLVMVLGGGVHPSFAACSLPTLPTVLSETGVARFLESIPEFRTLALSFNKRSFRIAVAAG